MKCLSVLIIIMSPILLSAQSITKEVYEFMKADDVIAFEQYVNTGNDINQCMEIEKAKYTFLTLAIKANSQKIFDKCIELKADLEQICSDKTPLMYTIKNDRSDMLTALLKAGVDRNQKSNRGKTAMDYTLKYDKPHLAKLLN